VYVVTVEFIVKTGHAAEFLPAMTENARASRECEPGCRQFDVCADPNDPHVIFLYELYDDRAAFDAHLATAHFKAFDARVAPWVERKTVRVYTRVQ
jgi:quinol monooxygenase YgiN